MTLEKIKKKGLKGVKTVIYGRTLFVIAAFLIQFAMMISVYLYLRDYSLFVYVAFIVLGILVVLHLFNNGKSPDFKMGWMLCVSGLRIPFLSVYHDTAGHKAAQEKTG